MHTCNQIIRQLCELIIEKKVFMINKNKIRRFRCVNKQNIHPIVFFEFVY
jgi:hypothetical protein